jgi:protein-tyrosine-phosphatase
MATEQETLAAIDEISTGLTAVANVQTSAQAELLKALAEIQGALNGQHIPGTVTDGLRKVADIVKAMGSNTDQLSAVAKALDDVVPDSPTEPAPTEPPVV